MKIIPILTLLICLQLGMWIFQATGCQGDSCGNLIVNTNATDSSAFMSSNLTGSAGGNMTNANLWDVILDPTNMGSSGWMTLLLSVVGLTGAISVGLYFIFRTDAIILFPVFTALLGFGSYTIINIWNLIHSETRLYGCTVGAGCYPANIVAFIVCAPLTLWFIFGCIDYWINRQGS